MSVLIDENTKVFVQAITGSEGSFHTRQMLEYGTKVVGGATPGKGGQEFEGIPVFNTVAEGVEATGANASIIFVPAPFAADAIMEAADIGIELVICITENIPVSDMVKAYHYVQVRSTRLIGPNCPGIISPGEMQNRYYAPLYSPTRPRRYYLAQWNADLRSRWAAYRGGGLGQSTAIGIGGDPIIGTRFVDALALFKDDPETDAVVMIGEIGARLKKKRPPISKNATTSPSLALSRGARHLRGGEWDMQEPLFQVVREPPRTRWRRCGKRGFTSVRVLRKSGKRWRRR